MDSVPRPTGLVDKPVDRVIASGAGLWLSHNWYIGDNDIPLEMDERYI